MLGTIASLQAALDSANATLEYEREQAQQNTVECTRMLSERFKADNQAALDVSAATYADQIDAHRTHIAYLESELGKATTRIRELEQQPAPLRRRGKQ